MSSNKNLSRRGFIAMSSLAGTGLLLSGNPLAVQSLHAEPSPVESASDKKFKIGIIGCGNRSKALIGALNHVPELEIAALCDIVPHKTQQRAQLIKTGAKPVHVSRLEELLHIADLDAIVIVTPNDTHKEIVIASLEAGKHVFCEKPLALTVADCNDIIGVVDRTRKSLQIGHQRRHSPVYKNLVEVIRTKPVGKILQSSLYDYRGDWRVPEADEYPADTPYWRLDQKRSGGVVYEMGAHIIDVNNWIFDSEPVSVSSLQGINNFSLRKRDSADHAGVLVQYANGSLLNYGGNLYNYGSTAFDTFFGVNGTVQVGNGNIYIRYGFPNGFPRPANLPQPETISLTGNNPESDGVVEQFNYFVKVIDGKEKAFPDAFISRQSVQIMEASVRSAQERRVIDVRELG
ncbi:Inositol 2-dehydrogenase [Bacteroidales bacterium Barb6XT]|nr:Inositol 2-dehydrogenase [Bacteroidales bacterium Barb6XT]